MYKIHENPTIHHFLSSYNTLMCNLITIMMRINEKNNTYTTNYNDVAAKGR